MCGKKNPTNRQKYCSKLCRDRYYRTGGVWTARMRAKQIWHDVAIHSGKPIEKFSKLNKYLNSLKHECIICGYNKSKRALAFHHVDTKKKRFNLSSDGLQWRTKEEVNEELKNCVVLCFNCHMELHDGLISLNKNVVSVVA